MGGGGRRDPDSACVDICGVSLYRERKRGCGGLEGAPTVAHPRGGGGATLRTDAAGCVGP